VNSTRSDVVKLPRSSAVRVCPDLNTFWSLPLALYIVEVYCLVPQSTP